MDQSRRLSSIMYINISVSKTHNVRVFNLRHFSFNYLLKLITEIIRIKS